MEFTIAIHRRIFFSTFKIWAFNIQTDFSRHLRRSRSLKRAKICKHPSSVFKIISQKSLKYEINCIVKDCWKYNFTWHTKIFDIDWTFQICNIKHFSVVIGISVRQDAIVWISIQMQVSVVKESPSGLLIITWYAG